MHVWWLIIIAAVVSFVLRLFPFVALRRVKLDAEHWVFQYLSFVVYAIMGCIIYVAAFPHLNWSGWWAGDMTAMDWLKLIILLAIFLFACRFRRHMLMCVIVGIVVYALLLRGLML